MAAGDAGPPEGCGLDPWTTLCLPSCLCVSELYVLGPSLRLCRNLGLWPLVRHVVGLGSGSSPYGNSKPLVQNVTMFALNLSVSSQMARVILAGSVVPGE